MMRCKRRNFIRGALGASGVGAIGILTRRALAADFPAPGAAPVPGAIALAMDRDIHLNASSETIRLAGGELRVLSVGTGTFHLNDDGQLTAKLHVAVAQYASAEYRIYAAVFDAKGVLLGTASHKEPVERIRLGRMLTALRQVELDFGKSRAFRRAAFVSVAISDPDFPRPEN